MVEINITYNSPDVTSPTGDDRTGKIWGQLVPYGLTNLGFGNGNPGPWRVGANENSTFRVSHDVLVEGQPLAAGTYGLHMIAGEEEWTVVFSNNSTSWGSFFYEESEDALRVTVKPESHAFREWLTFEFLDRQPTQTVASLQWENLAVPFKIAVPNRTELYLEDMRNELRSTKGFGWQGYQSAAQFCLQKQVNLEEALEWAEKSISAPFTGQANFTTLSTKAQILDLLDRRADAQVAMTQAMELPGTTVIQIHMYGRQLVGAGKNEEALATFQKNAERFPDTWPVNVGLARGYSAVGNYKKALLHAKKALENAPDDLNRQNLEGAIKKLAAGEAIN
jgi:tetratricopeptide (TPR) repeat protein